MAPTPSDMLTHVETLSKMLATNPGFVLRCAEDMIKAHEAIPGEVILPLDRVRLAAATIIVSGLGHGEEAAAWAVLRSLRLQVLDEDGGAP